MPHEMMRFFAYRHLPEGPLRQTSAKIGTLASELDNRLDESAEKTAGLRKLLEAKDCFVRAAILTEENEVDEHG